MAGLYQLQAAAPAPVAPEEEIYPAAPQEQYVEPAPESGGSGLYALEQGPQPVDYTAPPEQAPQEFIPGSTYRPVSLNQEQQQVQQAPPPRPASPNQVYTSGVPTDNTSGIGDVLGSIGTNLQQGDPKSAGMNILDAPGLANQNERNFIAQRAKDAALHGDPDYTTGNIGPSGFVENPGGILPNIGHGLLTTVSEFEGMPDWVPSSTDQQSIEYYRNNPEAVALAQEREKTEGTMAWYNVWNEAQGNTLDQGGIGGFASDAIRGGADPANMLMAGASGIGGGISQIARNAGHIGIARGTSGVVKGAEIAWDPLFEGGASLGTKAIQKIIPAFKPGDQVAGQIAQDKVVEGIGTAVNSVRNENPGITQVDWVGDAANAGQVPVAPIEPLALPEGGVQTTYQNGGNLGPKQLPPPNYAGVPVDAQEASRVATNLRAADEATLARNVQEANARPTADNAGGRVLQRAVDPTTGKERTQFSDGTLPTIAQMEGARKRLINVKPADFVPAQYGHAESQNALWRGILTQERYMLDGWSQNRINETKLNMADKSVTPAQRKHMRQRLEAGERFNSFLTQRVRVHGDEEVQRVLDNIQREADTQIQRGMNPTDVMTNAENRVDVLAKAVEDAGRKQSFEVVVAGVPIQYYGNSNTFLRPRPVGISSSLPPTYNPLREAFAGTIEGFPDVRDLSVGVNLLNRMGINPEAKAIKADPAFLQKFTRMILDPEGFRHTDTGARNAIEQRLIDGDITEARAQQLFDYLDIRKILYAQKAIAKTNSDEGLGIFRQGNDSNINWNIMKREHDRLTADWFNPMSGQIDAANDFDPSAMGIKLDELRALDGDAIDPEVMRERMDVSSAAPVVDVPTTGTEVRLEPDGSYGVYVDGALQTTATTEVSANVMARRLRDAASAAAPSTRRIDDIGEVAAPIVETPETPARKPLPPKPPKTPEQIVSEYPNLANKIDDLDTRAGKEPFTSRVRRSLNAMKADGSRIKAMGQMDLPDVGDPELDNSGMAYGMKLLLRKIDTDHALVIDGDKVPIYTYIKRAMGDLDNLPAMAKRIDPADKKGMRAMKDIKARYEKDLGDLDILALTDREKDEIVTMHVARLWAETNVPKQATNRYGLAGDMGRMVKNLVDFRRAVGLTNWAAAPRQFLNQYVGNMWGLFMGKPSAMLDMTNMAELRRHVKQLHGNLNAPNTQLENLMGGYGAGAPNTQLAGRMQGKTLGQRTRVGHEVEVTGALGRLKDIVAPKVIRDVVAAPDELAKGAVGARTFRAGMRREVDALPNAAKMTSARMASKRPGMEGITSQIEKKLPRALEKFRTDHFDRPQFTGEQLEQTIKDIFENDVRRGTVNRESLNVYADRMKRDWNTVVNSEKQYAAEETRRVMFSWDNSKADDLIQNVFLYHYWATRAGFLYSKEMIKRPYLINMYMDAAQQIQEEADRGDYPNWMRGFTRILNSPMGVALFMSPLDMIGTAFHLNEMEMGATDTGNETLTALGQLKGMFPFVWNPAIELALTFAGAFGPGASMPNNMTGLNRATGMAADIINYANYNGMLGDFGKDANGNPIQIAPRPFDDFILKIASHFGMPVVPSMSSFEKETTFALYDQITAKYGLLAPEELTAMTAEIYERAKQGDVDPMLYNAQAEALAMSMKGPELPLPEHGMGPGGVLTDWIPSFIPEALNPVFGTIARYTSPVRLQARNETGALIQYPDMANTLTSDSTSLLDQMAEAGGDEYAIKSVKNIPFSTPRRMSLEVAYADYYDGGNPELAELDDMYYDIGKNAIGVQLNVGGVDYTPSDINAMSEQERWDLAEDWLSEQGYTKSDLTAMQEYKEQIIRDNPDVGGYIAYQQYVRNYSGGPAAFAAEAMKTSPSFAAYMATQGDPASPDFFDYVDTKDAYFAISGEKSGVYDQDNVPEQGVIPGLPYGTNFITKYQTDKQLDEALSDESGNGFKQLVSDVTTDVNAIYNAQEWLNANYPGVKADGWLDSGVYKAMKAAGVSAPKTEDAALAYEYYTWLESNPTATDFSVEAFIDNRESTGGTSWEDLPDATPDMIAQQRDLSLTQSAPVSKEELQNIGIMGTLAQYSPLYYGPTDTSAVTFELNAGAPVKEIYRGADGWSQVYVPKVGGGQVIGWVPTASIAVG